MIYKRKFFLRFFLGSILILLIWFAYHCVAIYRYAQQYDDTPSDVAIVLGAGARNGVVSPVFRERINQAVKLWKSNKVKYIILTGGYGKNQTISDSKTAKNYALSQGVNKVYILIEEKSKITFLNLLYAKKIMRKHQLKTALLVSDPYHMKRAMHMCQALGINSKPSPTQTSMFRSWQTKLKFLLYEAFFYSIRRVIGYSLP